MKSLKEIRDELVSIGATQRLLELDKERATLIRLINGVEKHDLTQKVLKSIKKVKRYSSKGKSYNGKHWTQTAKGKAKLRARMLEQWKNK